MADIRIEKKRSVWPWIILVIILGVLAFLYIYGSMGNEETDDLEESEIEEVTSLNPPSGLLQNENEII